jgi:PAS domain S-box-containing protein
MARQRINAVLNAGVKTSVRASHSSQSPLSPGEIPRLQTGLLLPLLTGLSLGSALFLAILLWIRLPQASSILLPLVILTTCLFAGMRVWWFWHPPKESSLPLVAGLVFMPMLAILAVAYIFFPPWWAVSHYALIMAVLASAVLSLPWFLALAAITSAVFAALGWWGHQLGIANLWFMAVVVGIAGLIHALQHKLIRRAAAWPILGPGTQDSLREAMLAAHSFEGIAILRQGCILDCNEAFTAQFGWTQQEVAGMSFLDLLAPASRAMVSESIRLGSLRAFEATALCKNGSTFHAELLNRVLPREDGDLVVTAVRDISDRKRIEAQIEAERRELELLYHRQIALSEIDLAGDRPQQLQPVLDQTVQMATELLPASGGACVLLWDQPTSRLRLGATTVIKRLVPTERLPGFCPGPATQWIVDNRESLVISSIGTDPFGINLVFPGADVQAYAGVPMLSGGRLLGLLFALEHQPRVFKKEDTMFLNSLASKTANTLIFMRLIESLRQANLELEQQRSGLQLTVSELMKAREEAETTQLAQYGFLAKVTQELRAPIGDLLNTTNLLLLSSVSDEQRGCARALCDRAEALLNSVNAVHDYSDLTAGKLKLFTLDFDLSELLKNTLKGLLDAAQAKHLELTVHYNDHVPRSLRGDAVRLEQVLYQLLSNAIANTNEGQIIITIGRIETAAPRLQLKFEVRDTGNGISPADQAHMFEFFARRPDAPKPITGGLGLGLALSRRLVELMEGTMGYRSELGQGSTFWFVVPLEPASIISS